MYIFISLLIVLIYNYFTLKIIQSIILKIRMETDPSKFYDLLIGGDIGLIISGGLFGANLIALIIISIIKNVINEDSSFLNSLTGIFVLITLGCFLGIIASLAKIYNFI